MNHRSDAIRRPQSLRDVSRRAPRLLAIGIGAALIAGTGQAAENTTDDEADVSLDTLRVEDRAADANPYADADAPYQAKRSGDARRVQELADAPSTVSVVTQTQIRDSGQTDLRAVVAAQPGITIGTGENGNAFGDRYIIRGQEARSDVFIDGLRDPGMTIRESFAVEQVEIAKGPNSTYAGRGASGGTINSITKQASHDYDFSELELGVGTDRYHRATLDANLPLGERWAVRANLLEAAEDVPDRAPAQRERRGAALSAHWSGNERLQGWLDYYHLDADGAEDLGTYIVAGGGRPVADLPVYRQREDFLESQVDIATARLRFDIADGWRLENALRTGTTENAYVLTGARGTVRAATDAQAANAPTVTLSTHQGWQEVDYVVDQLNLFHDAEWGGMTHRFVFGVEYSDLSVLNGVFDLTPRHAPNCTVPGRTGATAAYCMIGPDGQVVADVADLMNRQIVRGAYDSDYAIDTASLYAMDVVDVADGWQVTLGLRLDDFDYRNVLRAATGVETAYDYGDRLWNGNAAISRAFGDDTTVYLSYATAADINGGESDVGGSCGYGGLCGTPQQVLASQPETVENLEFGAKWQVFDDQLLLTAAAFRIIKDDVMESVGNAYDSLGTLNTGKNRVRGIEVAAVGNFSARWSGQIAASVMDAEVLEAFVPNQIGKTLSNFAERSAHVQLRYAMNDRLSLGATATYQSERYAGQPDSAAAFDAVTGAYAYRVPSYTVVDAFANYQFSPRWKARLNVGNVFDKDYYLAAYRSGAFTYIGDARNARLTVSADF